MIWTTLVQWKVRGFCTKLRRKQITISLEFRSCNLSMPTTKPQVSFSLRNHLSELDRLNEQVELIGQQWKLPRRSVLQINLALEEIFTNIISYGFDDDLEHTITISLDYDGQRMQITMIDDGNPFDINQADNPDLNIPLAQKEVGGLGIFLIRQYMDEISYVRDKNKNIIMLTKNIL